MEVQGSNAMKKLGVQSLPEMLHIAFFIGIMEQSFPRKCAECRDSA